MSVRRYQLACAVLAFTTVASVSALHQRARSAPGPGFAAAGPARSTAERLRRPVRVAASALGLSESELIDRLLAARTALEVGLVAEKLAVVGTDDAVLAMIPLIDDARAGVAEAVIGAIGKIGTRRATDVVVDLLEDSRPRVRNAAVAALGVVADERAATELCAIARDRLDPARLTAIWALGQQGGEAAMTTLVAIARSGDPAGGSTAVMALAAIPGAQDALLALTEAPDLRVRVAALGALDATSPAAIARLTAVIAAGEPQTTQAALGALGRSGDPSVVPVLARAAGQSNMNLRWAAVSALGELGSPEAVDALGELLAHGDTDVAGQIAATLANLGGDEARAILIEVALGGGRRASLVLGALGSMRGEDVQAALVAIAKDGTPSARREALPLLLRAGAPEAVALASEMVASGSRADRLAAIAMLGEAPGDAARATLLSVAERERGPTRTAALDALAQQRPDDPDVTALLGDALLAGRPDEVSAAASILGRAGTPEARALLAAAIGDDDGARAAAAIGALGYGVAIDGDVRAALAKVAAGGPPALRAQATQQLLQAGGDDGVIAARTILAAGDPEAARQMVWALGGVGSDAAVAAIREAATATDAGVRAAAAQVMAQRPDEADTALLARLAHDSDPSVKVQALSTLGSIGSHDAVDRLLEVARSSSADDRVAAIGGLGMADDPRATTTLARFIEDGDPQVATAAIYASGGGAGGGDEIDRSLLRAFRGAADGDPRRYAAAQQLRQRGVELDDATARAIDAVVGPAYGGGMYGAYYGGPYYGEE